MRYTLRRGGKSTRAGRVFMGASVAWALFLVHSAVVQYTSIAGASRLGRAREYAILAASTGIGVAPARADLERARDLLVKSRRLGLFPSPQLDARIASASSHLGDHDAAERYYRLASDRAPGFAGVHVEVARYAQRRGDVEGTMVALRRAVLADPGLEDARIELVNLLIREQRGIEARELLDGLLRRRPHDVELRLSHAIVVAQLGDARAAIAATQRVLESHPDHPVAIYNLGQIHAKAGDLEAAFTHLSRAAEVGPDNPDIHHLLARVAQKLNRLDVASRHAARALEIEPYDVTYVSWWVQLNVHNGTADRAIERAEAVARESRAVRFRLLHLYRAVDRDDDADRLAAEFADDRGGP